jgi:hypothetical protein
MVQEVIMLALLATFSAASSRRITEIGALLGLIGGLILAGSTMPFLRRSGVALGGLLLAAGFVLIILAVHFGLNPYHAK